MRGNEPYYEDEHMQGMEGQYTVVDYTQPNAQDFNNPNTDKSVAIVDNSPKYTIEETNLFIEERVPPQMLAKDQQLEVLNLIEAGEMVSVELVTDNPYIALYIEMDDYKYKTPNGITAAELLMRGREEYAERHFYAEGPRPDGTYVIKFHPRTDYKYHDRLKILVRNDITKPSMFRGLTTDYNSRSNLPSPVTNGFNGAATIRGHPIGSLIASTLQENLHDIIARGINLEVTESPYTNDRLLVDKFTLAGVSHPFVGYAGRARHIARNDAAAADSSTYRVVWGEPGVAVTSETNAGDNITTVQWPGSPVGGTGGNRVEVRSTQQVIIYKSNAEDATAAGGPGLGLLAAAFEDATEGKNSSENSIFFKIGDTVYYPGLLTNLQYYDAGDSQFEEHVGGSGTEHNNSSDGALLLTFAPGFNFVPPKSDISETGTDGLGVLESLDEFGIEALIQEVNVKRKKKKTLI